MIAHNDYTQHVTPPILDLDLAFSEPNVLGLECVGPSIMFLY
jgi:hypothetical protein